MEQCEQGCAAGRGGPCSHPVGCSSLCAARTRRRSARRPRPHRFSGSVKRRDRELRRGRWGCGRARDGVDRSVFGTAAAPRVVQRCVEGRPERRRRAHRGPTPPRPAGPAPACAARAARRGPLRVSASAASAALPKSSPTTASSPSGRRSPTPLQYWRACRLLPPRIVILGKFVRERPRASPGLPVVGGAVEQPGHLVSDLVHRRVVHTLVGTVARQDSWQGRFLAGLTIEESGRHARPPVFPAEEKVRIVLSILAGEITVCGGCAAGEGVRVIGRELEAPAPRSRQVRTGSLESPDRRRGSSSSRPAGWGPPGSPSQSATAWSGVRVAYCFGPSPPLPGRTTRTCPQPLPRRALPHDLV